MWAQPTVLADASANREMLQDAPGAGGVDGDAGVLPRVVGHQQRLPQVVSQPCRLRAIASGLGFYLGLDLGFRAQRLQTITRHGP